MIFVTSECGSKTGGFWAVISSLKSSSSFVLLQDGLKPVQVAAARGNKAAVEILLPVTAPIESIPQWSIDGILQHMQQEIGKEEVLCSLWVTSFIIWGCDNS